MKMSSKNPYSLKSYRLKILKTKIRVLCREENEKITRIYQLEFKKIDDVKVRLAIGYNKFDYDMGVLLERAGYFVISYGDNE